MKTTFLILLTALLTSCATNSISRLTKPYQDRPYEVTSTSSLDDTWNKVIDVFSSEGYPIQVLEKASGLIVTQRMDFTSSTTIEHKGKPKISSAYFISEAYSNIYGKQGPTEVEGQWNVRVKEIGNKVVVAINIVNIRGEFVGVPTTYGQARSPLKVKSTGVFEKKIASLIAGPNFNQSAPLKAIATEAPAQFKSTKEVVQTAPEVATTVGSQVSEIESRNSDFENNETEISDQEKDLEFQKKDFEMIKESILSELDEKEAVLDSRESDLDGREVSLNLRETELNAKEKDIAQKMVLIEATTSVSRAVASSVQSKPILTSQPEKVIAPSTTADNSLPFRYIQFTATGGGKAFNNLAYLGEVVSEKVPGRNLYRYKIKGQFTDGDVSWVISELGSRGFSGAFEN